MYSKHTQFPEASSLVPDTDEIANTNKTQSRSTRAGKHKQKEDSLMDLNNDANHASNNTDASAPAEGDQNSKDNQAVPEGTICCINHLHSLTTSKDWMKISRTRLWNQNRSRTL
jgi:hypothetical protein